SALRLERLKHASAITRLGEIDILPPSQQHIAMLAAVIENVVDFQSVPERHLPNPAPCRINNFLRPLNNPPYRVLTELLEHTRFFLVDERPVHRLCTDAFHKIFVAEALVKSDEANSLPRN